MHVNPSSASTDETAVDQSGFVWPIAFMRREQFKKGEYLFRLGDRAETLYYIAQGSIRLPELRRRIGPRQVMGEMGLFSPNRSRSASALVEDDVEAYSMGREEVQRLMSRDPGLATTLIEVIIKRMMEHLKEETEARERINSELRIARHIQSSMLPRVFPAFPARKEFEIYALMEPANEIGGDLYDFFLVAPDRLCALVGDVSGKGIPAALFMALTKSLLRSEALQGYSPGAMLSHVNQALCADNHECMFVTVFCLILDTRTGQVEFCTAGQNPPLFCSADGAGAFLNAVPGLVIGFEEALQYQSETIRLQPGEALFLYTDGVTEAENPKQEPFSDERFKASILGRCAMPLEDIVAGLRGDITQFTEGHVQSDDLTLLGLRYHGSQ